MRNLFRSFDRLGVEYLLISGQASVLYGAANFSEDVDVWVRPTAANLGRLERALAGCRARVYTLTPPLSVRNLRRGSRRRNQGRAQLGRGLARPIAG